MKKVYLYVFSIKYKLLIIYFINLLENCSFFNYRYLKIICTIIESILCQFFDAQLNYTLAILEYSVYIKHTCKLHITADSSSISGA